MKLAIRLVFVSFLCVLTAHSLPKNSKLKKHQPWKVREEKPELLYTASPPCEATGFGCVSDCTGASDGFHQYCANCTHFVHCNQGTLTMYSCPDGQVWDQGSGFCVAPPSPTCWHCYSIECGSVLHHLSQHSALPLPWDVMCYITPDDTQYVNTPCSNLVMNVRNFGNSGDILAQGGNFGCWRGVDGVGGEYGQACTDNYQQNITLGTCPTCNIMAVCIRYPLGGKQ